MPGIVDGHMHPLQAGTQLLKCGLDYASLTVAESAGARSEVSRRIDRGRAGRLARSRQLVSGEHASRRRNDQPCDARRTEDAAADHRSLVLRPHGARQHARAAAGEHQRRHERPVGGKIWRDASGEPTGVLEDAAFAVFDSLLPQPTAADNVAAAEAALKAMRAQGITTFLDAVASR